MPSIPVLKVVIAGEASVGKTALVRRFCEDRFETSHIITIGVDFQTKIVALPDGPVKLSIWDLSGKKRYETIRTGFYRGSLATTLVYDLSNDETLKDLSGWYMEIKKTLPQQKFLVVGNKLDLVTGNAGWVGKEFARLLGAGFMETSALSGAGVETMFEILASYACLRMT
ncbi:MAG: GTP-binding protein [Chloroflexi bacterium]|nr:GTP-binding protein [Chloroflexota bacterium]